MFGIENHESIDQKNSHLSFDALKRVKNYSNIREKIMEMKFKTNEGGKTNKN